MPAPLDDRPDHDRGEVVGADARQGAAVAADRRPDGLDDPGLAQGSVQVSGHAADCRVGARDVRPRRAPAAGGRAPGALERPTGWPAPSRRARSMSSAEATPSSTASRASPAIAARIRSRIARRRRRPSGRAAANSAPRRAARPVVVPVEALAGLASEAIRRRRAPPGSATAGAGRAARGPPRSPVAAAEVDVDADQVHQLERAHRKAVAADRAVDRARRVASPSSRMRSASIVNGRLTRLTMKPGRSAQTDRRLAPGRRRSRRRVATTAGRSRGPATTSTSAHDRRRIEEVEPDDALRSRGRGGDRGDRQGARVRGEDRRRRRRPRRAPGRSPA